MEKPIVIYTDHIMNKTLCYNFAKGSDALMCHVNDFNEYDKTIATYGVLRGTYDYSKSRDRTGKFFRKQNFINFFVCLIDI